MQLNSQRFVWIVCGLLLLGATPAKAAWLDSFGAGAQSLTLVGGTYPSDRISGSAEGLDSTQVFSGRRSLRLIADLQGPFRGLGFEDRMTAVVAGATPGSLNCAAAIVDEPGAVAYHPGVELSYWSETAVDCSAYERLVLLVSTPPTVAMSVAVDLNWTASGVQALFTLPPGASQLEVPFSAFPGLEASQLQGVSVQFRFGAETDSFGLAGIRMDAAATLPQVSLARTPTNSVVVSWPVSAASFVPQHSASLNPTAWSDLASPYQTNGSEISLAVPMDSSASGFFRLRQGP